VAAVTTPTPYERRQRSDGTFVPSLLLTAQPPTPAEILHRLRTRHPHVGWLHDQRRGLWWAIYGRHQICHSDPTVLRVQVERLLSPGGPAR
jgi:hypothetical protein